MPTGSMSNMTPLSVVIGAPRALMMPGLTGVGCTQYGSGMDLDIAEWYAAGITIAIRFAHV
jgi:hypothetical protein